MIDPSKIRPFEDRVVIKRDDKTTKTTTGLHIPTQAQENQPTGVVIAVGLGRWHEGSRLPMECKVGDRVWLGKYSGSKIELGEDVYAVVREGDLVGIMPEDED